MVGCGAVALGVEGIYSLSAYEIGINVARNLGKSRAELVLLLLL